ncbi:MAG TPA: hypothetical protein VNO26_05510 [Candidatus Limnocylindria bacterium]|nr:hypothetical protein [Candidatus Limnocylindria bacterium]
MNGTSSQSQVWREVDVVEVVDVLVVVGTEVEVVVLSTVVEVLVVSTVVEVLVVSTVEVVLVITVVDVVDSIVVDVVLCASAAGAAASSQVSGRAKIDVCRMTRAVSSHSRQSASTNFAARETRVSPGR